MPKIIQNVTGKPYDIHMLKQIYKMCERHMQTIENNYTSNFSELESLNIFDPKIVIHNMLQTHVKNTLKIVQLNSLEEITITFCEDGDTYEFNFSNNLRFAHDIVICSYLYHILHNNHFNRCETLYMLKTIMFSKYEICEQRENSAQQNKMTLLEIALAFPSITWDIACNCGFWTNFFNKFPEFDIPKPIFIPMVIPLLPKLVDFPLAIIMALIIKTDHFRGVQSLPLLKIMQNINSLQECNMYPDNFKLELCKKWQIVVIKNGEYKYAPCFKRHFEKAKEIIESMRPDDPDLEAILFIV